MEHSTPLQKLPEGIVFPSHLADHVCFDKERGRLTFRGFMTKCAYDELIALSGDMPYRRAVERLFVLSSDELSPPTARRFSPLVLAAVAVGSLALAVLIGWAILRTGARGHVNADGVPATKAAENK